MDPMPHNLRNFQHQLNAAIRAHRNLVGRTSICPHDRDLQLKVQSAERLIVRIYQAQKPLLEEYKKDCERRRVASSVKHGNRLTRDKANTMDDVLDDGIRSHFCPSTLDRWGNSVGGLSPEKKRKINFLGLFDLVTPKLSSDIIESKAPHRKRRQELVNTDFQVLLGHPVDPSSVGLGCKRFRSAAAAAAAATSATAAVAAAGACSSREDAAAIAGSSQGIVTRSSRRARGHDSMALRTLVDKSAMDSDLRHESGSSEDSDSRICCAGCLRIIPAPPTTAANARSTLGLCSACSGRRESRASGAIGLPQPASPAPEVAAAEVPLTEPAAKPKAGSDEVANAAMVAAANSSPAEVIAAAEMENKSLMQEAARWERNLLNQEQTRQMLMEKNCRAEKKLGGLLAQLNKINGM